MRDVSNVTQSLWGQGVSNNAKAVLLCYNNKKDKSKTDNKTGKIQYNTEKSFRKHQFTLQFYMMLVEF